jgi:hypothetical protein
MILDSDYETFVCNITHIEVLHLSLHFEKLQAGRIARQTAYVDVTVVTVKRSYTVDK